MYDDRPMPRNLTPEGSSEDTEEILEDEVIEEDVVYDPAKQAPLSGEESGVEDLHDVEHPEEVVYDLEDEED